MASSINYKSPDIEMAGREGQMNNEATITDKTIEFNDFGIFANDNTYAISFNPYFNRLKTIYIENKPVRRPPTNEHRTKINNYRWNFLFEQCLCKAEDLARIQGLANEPKKGNIIYGPTHTNNVSYPSRSLITLII